MSVHYVHLDPVGPGRLGLLHLLGQPAGVRGQDRGNYLDSAYWPAAARSINHLAPAIIPDGTSPRLAFATASALPAPVARTSTVRAVCSALSVSVTRCGGGLGESRMPAVRPCAFSAGWPGNRDAVCPSSPILSTTTSRGAAAATTCAYRAAPSSGPSSAGIR